MNIRDILSALDKSGVAYEATGTIDGNTEIKGLSSLFRYREGTFTFIVPERRFEEHAPSFSGHPIALMILGRSENAFGCFQNAIRVDDPRRIAFLIADLLFPADDGAEATGISADPLVYGRHSFIAPGAVIGQNVKIGVGCVIEGGVVIGDDTEIHHRVVIRTRTRIGKRCTIHSGVIIGENGFGYTVNSRGEKTMLRHYGGVCIEDDVHIGDNSCIIRGAIDDTIIRRGVKCNTMVHIAHNVVIGENTIITAPTHICGSVEIGRLCHIAGAVIRNQCKVGDRATIGLGAVVVKDVEEDSVVAGNPAKPLIKTKN